MIKNNGWMAACQQVHRAIKKGVLPKLNGNIKCADCTLPATKYDYRDYNKPLDVVAVCYGCNIRRGSAIPRKPMKTYLRKPMKTYHASTRPRNPSLINRLIKEFGSIEDLASALGVSYRSVMNWQRGKPISRLAYRRIEELSVKKIHRILSNSVGVKK